MARHLVLARAPYRNSQPHCAPEWIGRLGAFVPYVHKLRALPPHDADAGQS